jgi:hypothetical protein
MVSACGGPDQGLKFRSVQLDKVRIMRTDKPSKMPRHPNDMSWMEAHGNSIIIIFSVAAALVLSGGFGWSPFRHRPPAVQQAAPPVTCER